MLPEAVYTFPVFNQSIKESCKFGNDIYCQAKELVLEIHMIS
jgi:hypothetical protein